MTTLFLPPRYTPDSISLWQAALAEGWSVRRVQGWRVTEVPDGPLCLYGEPLFASTVAAQVGLALLAPTLDWLPHLPAEYLQRSVRFDTLTALPAFSFPAFVKPADDKCFVAKVYDEASALPDAQTLPTDTPILIAEPVIWEREFRCFIRHRRLMALSLYARLGEYIEEATPDELAETQAFVATILADERISLPPATVLDVGTIRGRGWAIVEANPAWGSGIYGCEPRQVLHTLAASCRRLDEIGEADSRWVVNRAGLDD